ncbi:hypothetical protein IH785_12325 [candidate division KSB1 bacterium]|nr:hypothetical protein [candidate division KSB1 bacterium]
MKLKNLFFAAAVLGISINCSNKAGLGPTSSESDALNKISEELVGENFSHDRGNALLTLLNVTDEQKAQIKEIRQSKRQLFKPHEGQFKERLSFEDRKAKRKEVHESIKNEIYAVLTPEQQAKLDQLKSQLENGEVPQDLINLHIERLDTKLSLSEEQKNQIRALDTWEKLLLKHELQENRRGFFMQKKELYEEHAEKISNILTPEQKEVFLEMQMERKAKMKNGRRFRGAHSDNRIEKLARELDLNESQKEQIEEIFTKIHSEIRGELNGKRNGRTREELRQAMRNNMKEVHQQIQSILTPEQMKKFEEFKAQRKERMQEHFPEN